MVNQVLNTNTGNFKGVGELLYVKLFLSCVEYLRNIFQHLPH